jgi:hypothetical protein
MFYLVYTITLLYLACPDMLNTVGDTSYVIWVRFIRSLLSYLFMYLFVSEVQSLLLSV